jgi:hypothetical protein
MDAVKYDSREDTEKHINRVRELINICRARLEIRAAEHDLSKLQNPEKETFDVATPKLKASTYGSDEYKKMLADIKPALDHHYAANQHHPEHYSEGIKAMSLLDILEMLCDWKAAGERHANGSIQNSLKVNAVRFAIGTELRLILENTVRELGWNTEQKGKSMKFADTVNALNKGGILTRSCCCGHGKAEGSILLQDGRKLRVV